MFLFKLRENSFAYCFIKRVNESIFDFAGRHFYPDEGPAAGTDKSGEIVVFPNAGVKRRNRDCPGVFDRVIVSVHVKSPAVWQVVFPASGEFVDILNAELLSKLADFVKGYAVSFRHDVPPVENRLA